MENYIVSARKYRPTTFKSVVGQQSLTHTLKAVIDNGKLAHAYLFCGPRGVGKTSCARIFAKTINCLNKTADGEACNECESCKAFNEQRSYNIVELDAASNNSVDDIRNLIDQVRIPPQIGKYRVFIIDEVHMLSTQAFNAFLKTLEEPPAHAIFILATTEKHKIIPTILSRCQIYDFSRITIQDIVQQLQYIAECEHISVETSALNVIAQKADGAMRDALSIFDQVAASCEGNITYKGTIANLNVLDHDYYFKLVEAFLAGDVPQSLLIYKDVRDHGFDSQFFVNGLAQHLRDLMVASTPQTKSLLEMSNEVAEQFVLQASKIPVKFFYRAMDLCESCDLNYRTATNKQFLVELTLVKICQIFEDPTPPTGGGQPLRRVNPAATSAAPAAVPTQTQASAPTQTHSNVAAPTVAATPVASAPASAAPQATVAPEPLPGMPVAHTISTPVPTPAPAPRPAAAGRPPRISINRPNGGQDNGASATPTSERRLTPFTPEQFAEAWNQYIFSNPQEALIVNAMRSSMPRQLEATRYLMEVENAALVDMFNNVKGKILTFVRDVLKNDMVALDIAVRKSEAIQRFMSPREVIESIRERNPLFTDFVKSFRLTLT